MSESKSVVKKIVSMGEERVAEIVEELMSNEKVSAVVAKALSRTQGLKARLDKNVSLALSLLNQPTREDFDKLRKQVRHLERSLEDLSEKVDELAKAATHKKKAATAKAEV